MKRVGRPGGLNLPKVYLSSIFQDNETIRRAEVAAVIDPRPISLDNGMTFVVDLMGQRACCAFCEENGRAWPLGLLGRARSLMQGWGASTPQSQEYDVRCPEGHRVRGVRTEGYQAIRCPTCSEGIFILPRSPFPEPPAPARPASNRSRVEPEPDYADDSPLELTDAPPQMGVEIVDEGAPLPEAEIDWVEPTPSPTNPPAQPSKKRAPAGRPAQASPARAAASAVAEDLPEAVPVPRQTWGEWAQTHRNALIVAGGLLIVVAGVLIKVRRQRFEEMPRLIEAGRVEGIESLDAGDFTLAKKILSQAAAAVEALGGQIQGANEVTQAALEAGIFADLAPAGLDEILEEADFSEPARWPAKFNSTYRGRSVIIEATVVDVPDPSKPDSTYTLNVPLLYGRGPKPKGRGRIDLKGFRLFELDQPKAGSVVLFGARYRSVEFDNESKQWLVTFEPNSGAFITHSKALDAIHWPTSVPEEEPAP